MRLSWKRSYAQNICHSMQPRCYCPAEACVLNEQAFHFFTEAGPVDLDLAQLVS
jgi:hypothetical protein